MEDKNVCFYCGKEINENNKTEEHIIPNYIGGRLKSKDILCRACNSRIGENVDVGFKDLEFFTNLLNPCRDRNKNINSNSIKCKILSDGKIYECSKKTDKSIFSKSFHFNQKTGELKINILFTKQEDLDTFFNTTIKTVISGYMEKRGATKQKINAKLKETYQKLLEQNGIIYNNIIFPNFQLNKSKKIFLSALKVVLEYFIYEKFDKNFIQYKINDLKNLDVNNIHKYSNYYFNVDFFDSESINHLVYLKGDNINKLLYGVLSFYGVFTCIFLLNDNYSGENFEKSYYYDLIENKELTFDKSLNLNNDDFTNILSFYKDFDTESFEYNVDLFMQKIKKWSEF